MENHLYTDRYLLTLRNALQHLDLASENVRLKAEVHAQYYIVRTSRAVKQVIERIEKVAPTAARVLITGENGTGKELVARAIHALSPRARGPFVEVNCAAIPTELIESELFGHMKGSFTGAFADRSGKFELADGGTLFLDEIGDMSLSAQAKVLRALEEGVISRVGSGKTLAVDVRVVAATNKDLRAEIAAGRFREDLLYRLNVVPIEVPPLRARRADVPQLVEHFTARLTERGGLQAKGVDPEALKRLAAYDWPGNIRELRNAVERLLILATGPTVTVSDVERIAAFGTGDGGRGTGPADGAARRRRASGRRRATGHVGQGGARRARGGRRCAGRLALHARLRSAPDLLSGGRHHRDCRGIVVQHLLLETAARRGARHLTSLDHLGYPVAHAGSAAPGRRPGDGGLDLSRCHAHSTLTTHD